MGTRKHTHTKMFRIISLTLAVTTVTVLGTKPQRENNCLWKWYATFTLGGAVFFNLVAFGMFKKEDTEVAPTDSLTTTPSVDQTNAPTEGPSVAPTGVPLNNPTNAPTRAPLDENGTTVSPTNAPTGVPTNDPSEVPTGGSSTPTAWIVGVFAAVTVVSLVCYFWTTSDVPKSRDE